MAIQQNRKRPRADDPPQEHRPSKKLRAEGRTQSSSNFAPEFWDNLSKVWLTPRALRELDRRNDARPAPKPPAPAYPELRDDGLNMSSSRASDSSRRTKSTTATTISSKVRRSSAYDNDFEQHLVDYDVYPEGYEYTNNRQTPEPGNMDEARLELSAARASLSPSHFPESAFRDFKRNNNTMSEGTVMRNVIPIITGNASIPNEGNLPFTNLKSLTKGLTVKPVPDFFDGARPGHIDKSVREDLSQIIVPTKHADVPACYDGAYGARAMHSLQSYGEEEPVYDGKAYTYSSTYQDGQLKLYAHHVTAPTDPEKQPEYHMTQIDAYALTGSRKGFVEGATAFRNARDLARRHRDEFIHVANAKARRSDALLVDEADAAEADAAEAQQYGDSGSDKFVDCEEYVGSQAVAAENYAASQDIDEGSALPQYLHAGDEDYSQVSPSIDVGIAQPTLESSATQEAGFGQESDAPQCASTIGKVLCASLNIYGTGCRAARGSLKGICYSII
ncbi:hypothetical protein B0T17DRAFT_616584 [Bombardia bombarda]|uniref:Uncharacterized protein n=1 Tax=Bombardia bombarda TaxID=252184 RepID=A0AA39XCN8_9PEZI|nr:hypothetical protein B0T17DRAFT_616584 [Bombardia bombarda]